MRKIVLFFIIIAGSVIANCQDNNNLKATIAGYKPNDTIRIADCLKLSEITLNNKDYKVLSYTLFYSDNGYDYEIVAKSPKITDEMKNALSKISLKANQTKFFAIKDIKVLSAKKEQIKIDKVLYGLKMK